MPCMNKCVSKLSLKYRKPVRQLNTEQFCSYIRDNQEQKKQFVQDNKYFPQMSSTFGAEGLRGAPYLRLTPEVINILLFQRSYQWMDAPSEHIISRKMSVKGWD